MEEAATDDAPCSLKALLTRWARARESEGVSDGSEMLSVSDITKLLSAFSDAEELTCSESINEWHVEQCLQQMHDSRTQGARRPTGREGSIAG